MTVLTGEYQYIGRSNFLDCPEWWDYAILVYAKTTGNPATGKHSVTVKMRLACEAECSFYGLCTSGYISIADTKAYSWGWESVPNSPWNFTEIVEDGNDYPAWIDIMEATVEVPVELATTKDIPIFTSFVLEESDPNATYLPAVGDHAWSNHTVTLPMIAGLVYIDNGSGWEAYQAYVDNGSSWDLCIPYVDNGSGWDPCT